MTSKRRRSETKRGERLLREESLLTESAAGTILEDGLGRRLCLLDIYRSIARQRERSSSVWPASAETLLQSLQANDRLRAVLDLDGETLDELAAKAPDAIAAIRAALATGRLELLAGSYYRPLITALGGESILRQLARYLAAVRGALRIEPETCLVDERQIVPQLPQTLGRFGFRGVIALSSDTTGASMAGERGGPLRLLGPDGSEMPVAFVLSVDSVESSDGADLLNWSNERLESLRLDAAGPSPSLLCRVHGIDSWDGPVAARAAVAARDDVRFVTPREYFKDVGSVAAPQAAGSWRPAIGPSQRELAETENTLLLAERLDALGYAMGRISDERELEEAWTNLLRSQANVEGARENARAARTAGRALAETAAKYLASYVDSSGVEGRGLVIFNPSSWARDEYMEVTLGGEGYRIAQGGREAPSQVVERRGGYVTLGFVAHVPALGYRLLEVRPLATHEIGVPSVMAPAGRFFANAFYSAEISERGSLSLEASGDRLADAAAYLAIRTDVRLLDSRDDVRAIEAERQGPVFDRYLVEGRLAGMPFHQWLTFYKELARIDVRTEIDFGRGTVLGPASRNGKASPDAQATVLSLDVQSPLRRLFVDSPFFLGDAVEGHTVALSLAGLDDERERGIAVLNRGACDYRFDSTSGILQSALVQSTQMREAPLKGVYSWACALLPFASRLEALRSALDYQVPCLGAFVTPHSGNLPPEGSFLSVEPPEALLSAMFVRQGKVYVRLWNGSAVGVQANVGSGGPLSLRRCSLDLVDEAPAGVAVPLRPWGMQTLRLSGAGEA